ncbi:MAG: invasion associated locus B family protein [Rhodospirillales bacterium]
MPGRYDATVDRAIVAAMKAGQKMTVRGTSARGTITTDTYSLSGFSAALAAIDKACAK